MLLPLANNKKLRYLFQETNNKIKTAWWSALYQGTKTSVSALCWDMSFLIRRKFWTRTDFSVIKDKRDTIQYQSASSNSSNNATGVEVPQAPDSRTATLAFMFLPYCSKYFTNISSIPLRPRPATSGTYHSTVCRLSGCIPPVTSRASLQFQALCTIEPKPN